MRKQAFKPVVAALTVAAIALTSACATESPDLPEWPSVQHNSSDDLPYGAAYMQPDEVPNDVDAASDSSADIDNTGDEEPFGSIKPDTREPKERVPQIMRRGRLVVGVAQSLNRSLATSLASRWTWRARSHATFSATQTESNSATWKAASAPRL